MPDFLSVDSQHQEVVDLSDHQNQEQVSLKWGKRGDHGVRGLGFSYYFNTVSNTNTNYTTFPIADTSRPPIPCSTHLV